MKKLGLISFVVLSISVNAFAQPRPAEKAQLPAVMKTDSSVFPVKYQGGLFGYHDKEAGTLKLDDINERVVFFGKDQKEKFGIPYKALLIVYPDSSVSTATTGKVMSSIPLPGAGLFGLMKEKKRFLVMQFNDPDVDVKGIVNFKVENKELLQTIIQTIGVKANLTQRGDTVYRPRTVKSEI